MIALLHRAIERLADKQPQLLKNRNATKHYLLQICWYCVKRDKLPKEKWPAYFQTIKMLLDEYCHN